MSLHLSFCQNFEFSWLQKLTFAAEISFCHSARRSENVLSIDNRFARAANNNKNNT